MRSRNVFRDYLIIRFAEQINEREHLLNEPYLRVSFSYLYKRTTA